MIQKGQIVKSDSGRRIRADGLIKAGGQGEAHWATEINSGQKGVLKVFHKRFATADTAKRIRFLVEQNLHLACPVLRAPVDQVTQRDLVAHYTPFAEGSSLEELLANPTFTFGEGIQLAVALAHSVSVMHGRNLAHGDLHAENLIVNRAGTVYQLHLIDFDNFNASGMPAPPCVGHPLYMAPELRAALASGRPATPAVATDLYSLGVLMHEVTLLCHVAAGNDGNEADFEKAMCSGRWLLDPAASNRGAGSVGGYPSTVLNADLARLVRSAVSVDPTSRPSALVWEAELCRAFNAVYCCPKCTGPCVIDVSKVSCPLCGSAFPHLSLLVNGSGKRIPLENGSTVVGRLDLGGSARASVRHAVFRRIGPETWIESTGRNGTYRWSGSAWTKLPERKPLLVQAGDRLRLGDVEAQLN